MASTVVSKNLYELLGNDHEYDSDKEPEPETKTVAAKSTRTTKRNAEEAVPAAPAVAPEQTNRGGQKARRGGPYGGSEGAFRDRAAGRTANEGKPTDDGLRQDRHSHGGGRGYDRFGPGSRGGRGGRGNHHKDDRHSRGVPNDHVKQGDAAWGAATGEAELNDEVEGEKIAQEEAAEGRDTTVDAPVDADGNKLDEKEAEPEDNSKSYADYLIEQAEKKLSLAAVPEARKPNEGSKPNKQWESAKQFTSTKTEEENYFSAPAREKATKEKKQSARQVVDIDHRFVEQPRAERGGRGGRGGDRPRGGDRGRGDSTRGGEGRGRGGRGRGEFRGRGGDRPRGEFRGGSGRGANVNVSDESAFPSLGGN